MSEGDVSLIQDEDVLRRMWQQTDDFGRKKEIRAHMYRLREERLRSLYGGGGGGEEGGGESDCAPPPAPADKGGARRAAHSDSFADQCFQSLKSKEIRDSESPTRDYNYSVQDADNSSLGWTVVAKNEVSDDGKTHSEMTVAHKSGSKEIDGGNAFFSAIKENAQSVTQHEDENTKMFSAESNAKSVAKEQFISKTDDGLMTSSTTSSVGSSVTQSSYSQRYDSNQDFRRGGSDILTTDRENVTSFDNSADNKYRSGTDNIRSTSTTIKSQESRHFDEGELISRKVEHPDEHTTVIIEKRSLPDGTIITSTSRETTGSYLTKAQKNTGSHVTSGRDTVSSQVKVNKHVKQTESDDVSEVTNKRRTADITTEDKLSSTNFKNSSVNTQNSTVIRTNLIDLSENILQDTSFSEKDDITKFSDYNTKSSNIIDEHSTKIIENKFVNDQLRDTTKSIVEEALQVDRKVLESQFPKPVVEEVVEENILKKTTGEYITTYQADYTTKRISVDLSPTHEAWARSLRASPESTLPGGTSIRSSNRSLKTSTTSLRSSSPEKSSRSHSPRKQPDSSPTRTTPKSDSSPTRKPSIPDFTSTRKSPKLDSSPTRTSPKSDYSPTRKPAIPDFSSTRRSPIPDSSPKSDASPTRKSPKPDSSPTRTSPKSDYSPTRKPAIPDFSSTRRSPTRTSPKSDASPTRKPSIPDFSSTRKSPKPDSSPTRTSPKSDSSPTRKPAIPDFSPTRKSSKPDSSPTRKPAIPDFSPTRKSSKPDSSPTRKPSHPDSSPTRISSIDRQTNITSSLHDSEESFSDRIIKESEIREMDYKPTNKLRERLPEKKEPKSFSDLYEDVHDVIYDEVTPQRSYSPSDVTPRRSYSPSDMTPRRSYSPSDVTPKRSYSPSDMTPKRSYSPSDVTPRRSYSPTEYSVVERKGEEKSDTISVHSVKNYQSEKIVTQNIQRESTTQKIPSHYTTSTISSPSRSPVRKSSDKSPSRNSPRSSPSRKHPSYSPSVSPTRKSSPHYSSTSPTRKSPSGSPTRNVSTASPSRKSPSSSPSRKQHSTSPYVSPTRKSTPLYTSTSPSRSSPSHSPTRKPSEIDSSPSLSCTSPRKQSPSPRVSPTRKSTPRYASPTRSPTRDPSEINSTQNVSSISPSRSSPRSSPNRKETTSSRVSPTRMSTSRYPSTSPTRKPTDIKLSRTSPGVSPTRKSTPHYASPASSPTRKPSEIYPTRKMSSTSPSRTSPISSPNRKQATSPCVSPTRRSTPGYPSSSPSRISPARSPTRKPSDLKSTRNLSSTSPSRTSPRSSPSRKQTTSPYVSPTRKSTPRYPSTSPTRSSPTRKPLDTSPTRKTTSSCPNRKQPTSSSVENTSSNSPNGTHSPSPRRPSNSPTTVSPSRIPTSQSPTRGYSPPMYRKSSPSPQDHPKIHKSRDSSPTTSVSEIEFITNRKNTLVTNVDESVDDIDFKKHSKMYTSSEFDTTNIDSDTYTKETISSILKKSSFDKSSEVIRKSSLKKSALYDETITTDDLPPKTCQVSPTDDRETGREKPDQPEKSTKSKPKAPFVRSETYEERCRKILGMPDKKTLVEGAEKNLSEILGNLTTDSKPATSPKRSPYSSPERELTANIKSAEIRRPEYAETTTPRKSSLKKTTDTQYTNLVDAEYIKVDEDGIVTSLDEDEKKMRITDTNSKINKHDDSMRFIENELNFEKDNRISSPSNMRQSTPKEVSSPRRTSPDKLRESSPRSVSPEKMKPKDSFKNDIDVKKPVETKATHTTRKSPLKEVSTVARGISPSKDIKSVNTTHGTTDVVCNNVAVTNKISEKTTRKLDELTTSADKRSPDRATASPSSQIPSLIKDTTRPHSPQKKSPEKQKPTCKISKELIDKTPSKISTVDSKKPSNVKTNLSKPANNVDRKYEPTRTILTTQKYDIFKNDKNVKKTDEKKTVTSTVNIKKTTRNTTNDKITSIASKFDKDKKKCVIEITSDEEIEIAQPKPKNIELRRRNMDDTKQVEPQTTKICRSLTPNTKENKAENTNLNTKITRTTSDITMKTIKTSPTRMRSKPEINVSKVNTAKTVTTFGNSVQKSTTATNRISSPKTSSKTQVGRKPFNAKPKSSYIGSKIDEDSDVYIQQSKSSRENSPDRICPMPVKANDDSGKLRYPDKVTEPDDYTHKKKTHHQTIHESELLTDRIVEISDDEFELMQTKERISDVDRVNGSDECLLSVSDKVSKFANVYNVKTEDHTRSAVVKDFIKHEIDSNLENDECLLSVNDKVSRFLSTAEKITEPMKLSDPAPKKERPDLSMVDDDLKTDECLLSVTDKVSKFINTAEKITSTEKSPGLVSKASRMINDVKSKFEQYETTSDIQSNAQKETIPSPTKKLSTEKKHMHIKQTTPERTLPKPLSTPEKSPNTRPITTLRSSEAVKKAKALFENIATQKPDTQPGDVSYRKTTKLTDIGVYKKSPTAESVPDVVPKIEIDASSVDSESEVEIAPNVKSNKVTHSNGTYERPGKHPKGDFDRDVSYKGANTNKEFTTKNIRLTTEKQKKDVIYQLNNKQESVKNIETNNQNGVKMRVKDTEVGNEDIISTRRGSGKFGVELRRTSIDQAFNAERRHSNTGDQSTIEDIHDLTLLEQMLEKVTGYEQRRRIRSQIRIVRKNMENTGRTESSIDKSSSRRTTSKSTVSQSQLETKLVSEHRKTSHFENETFSSSVGRRQVKETNTSQSKSPQVKIQPETKRTRSTSPEKRTSSGSPERRREMSPEKRSQTSERVSSETKTRITLKENDNRNASPDRKTAKPSPDKLSSSSPKVRNSKVSEYTTAYLRKISGSNNLKPEAIPKIVNIKKEKDEITESEYRSSFSRKTSSTERVEKSAYSTKESSNSRTTSRSPSPTKRSPSPVEKLYRRSPSPDWKRPREDESPKSATEYQSVFSNFKSKPSTKELFNTVTKKKEESKPEWATTNILRKTSEKRAFNTKKVEEKKTVKRSQSPSKLVKKPIDVITSSYGVGPTDENGKPMFGLKALRKHSGAAQNFEVKGTIVREEFHSENGGEPVGRVTVTAYSSDPADLTMLSSGGRGSGADCITTTTTKSGGGITSVTKTKRYGATSGNSISKIFKQTNQPKAIEGVPQLEHPRVVRKGSVKTLTEKFIQNAVETGKTEKSSYPKAGLILRSNSLKDASEGVSSRSSSPGLARSDSNHSLDSADESETRMSVEYSQHRCGTTTTSSFLDSNTKVSGVQDILTRMKNADIVVEDGDTMEDSEARALLNKFLGATVLMAGMEGYVSGKPKVTHYKQESKTVVTKSSKVSPDIDDIWDERILRKLLEDSSDYEERRGIRARLRQVMAEQEACAQIVAAAAGEGGAEEPSVKGECPSASGPLPAPLISEVHGALARLKGALRPGQGGHLLELVARLQAGLLSAGRTPGGPLPSRNFKRRDRKARHTVGVTREELNDARRVVADMNFPLHLEQPKEIEKTVEVQPQSMPYVLQKQASLGDVLKQGCTSPLSPLSPQSPVRNATAQPFGFPIKKDEERGTNVLVTPKVDASNNAQEELVSFHNAPTVQQRQVPVKQTAQVEVSPIVNSSSNSKPVLLGSMSLDRGSDSYMDDVAKIVQESLIKAAQKKTEEKIVSSEVSIESDEEAEPVKANVILRQKKPVQIETVSKSKMNGDLSPNRFSGNFKYSLPQAPPKQEFSPMKNMSRVKEIEQKLINGNNNVEQTDIAARPTNRFSNKKYKMKRANTIDIPKPLHCYQVESDDEGAGNKLSADDNDIEKPKIPQFKPKTDNDLKFLAFIQKHNNNDTNSIWSPNSPSGQRAGCNWSSCFGSIKNVFEGSTADNSRSSSAASAKKFWKTSDDSINFSKPSNFGPKLTKSGATYLNSLHDGKKQSKLPWHPEEKEGVVTGSLMVAGPNIINGGLGDRKLIKPIPKPIPVNQFSHAPMSAFKPLPKKTAVTSPISAFSPANVWTPPSVSGKVKKLASTEFSKSDHTSKIIKNGLDSNVKNVLENHIKNGLENHVKNGSENHIKNGLENHVKIGLENHITNGLENHVKNGSENHIKNGSENHVKNGSESHIKNDLDNHNYLAAKPPTQKSPLGPTVPWAWTNSSKENRVLSLAANRFEKAPQDEVIAQPLHIPPYKEKNFIPANGSQSSNKRLSLPQSLHTSGPLSAPHLVQKLENLKQQFNKKEEDIELPKTADSLNEQTDFPKKIDAERLQIEFYEKQIREKGKYSKPSANVPATRRFSEHIPSDKYTYTVTDYTPPSPLSTFVPLPQIPDIEETNPRPLKKLPDLVLNNLNQESSQQSPVLSPIKAPVNNIPDSPKIKIEEQKKDVKEDKKKGEKENTEYKAITKVMKGPVSQQAVIKTKNTQDTYEKRDTAAKSLKGVLQKFSSPKHDVITQIEQKKKTSPEKIYSPQTNNLIEKIPSNDIDARMSKLRSQTAIVKPSQVSNSNMTSHSSQIPNSYNHQSHIQNNYNIPKIQYNNTYKDNYNQSIRSPEVNNKNHTQGMNKQAFSSDSLEINENGESVISSKLHFPHLNNMAFISPINSSDSQTPSPVALSKSESWHQLTQQNAMKPPSPRLSPRNKIVSRAKSMHLLSLPKQFEAGITKDKIDEKKKTVEAYFSGHISPNQLSKSSSQHSLYESYDEQNKHQSYTPSKFQPKTKVSAINRIPTIEKVSTQLQNFGLGRSNTMPQMTYADLALLDENNVEDAFEDLFKSS